jgi:predicted acetyltransferase
MRGKAEADEELQKIATDSLAFVISLVDPDAKGGPVTLPDGSQVPKLPGYRRWIWDGEFCGSIGFRWQIGTEALPDYCLRHIGYAVVPWKQRKGYATEALRQLLQEAKARGLQYIEITTEPENIASQHVFEKNGGVLIERFTKSLQYGETAGLRYRIALI